MDLKQIEELIKLVNNSGLSEFKLEEGDMKIKLVNAAAPSMVVSENIYEIPAAPGAPRTEVPVTVAPVDDGKFVYITSPLVGVFKSLSASDKTPIKIGDKLEIGQPVCVVEAMKLINEIESDKVGEVVEILVNEGDSVEFGQELIKIKV